MEWSIGATATSQKEAQVDVTYEAVLCLADAMSCLKLLEDERNKSADSEDSGPGKKNLYLFNLDEMTVKEVGWSHELHLYIAISGSVDRTREDRDNDFYDLAKEFVDIFRHDHGGW